MSSILDLPDESSDSESDVDYCPTKDVESDVSSDDSCEDEVDYCDAPPVKKKKENESDIKKSSQNDAKNSINDVWANFLKDVKSTTPYTNSGKLKKEENDASGDIVQPTTQKKIECANNGNNDVKSSLGIVRKNVPFDNDEVPNTEGILSEKIEDKVEYTKGDKDMPNTEEILSVKGEDKVEHTKNDKDVPKTGENLSVKSEDKVDYIKGDKNVPNTGEVLSMKMEDNVSYSEGDKLIRNNPRDAPKVVRELKQDKSLDVVISRPRTSLSSILGTIANKGKKQSVLTKSLEDWKTFKDEQGISKDLETFNKGRSGYIERQRFLQRSDVRSFENEKVMRLSKKRKD